MISFRLQYLIFALTGCLFTAHNHLKLRDALGPTGSAQTWEVTLFVLGALMIFPSLWERLFPVLKRDMQARETSMFHSAPYWLSEIYLAIFVAFIYSAAQLDDQLSTLEHLVRIGMVAIIFFAIRLAASSVRGPKLQKQLRELDLEEWDFSTLDSSPRLKRFSLYAPAAMTLLYLILFAALGSETEFSFGEFWYPVLVLFGISAIRLPLPKKSKRDKLLWALPPFLGSLIILVAKYHYGS